jgi:ADP-heptose:LPS heptosyltransferase
MTSSPVALVLRALYLGDFVTGLPALRLLRQALPRHRIVLAAPRRLAPLAALAGTVDVVVAAAELAPLQAAPLGADVAVDLHGNGPASRALLAERRPRRLVAFGLDGRRWRAGEHEVTRWCRLVAESFPLPMTGWPDVPGSLAVPHGAEVDDIPAGLTILHPGAKARARQWPLERFARAGRALAEAGHRLAVTGGPGEEQLACELAASCGGQTLSNLSLLQLAALVARARLVVSGDTGIAHLAAAYAMPSVVLFGPVSPAEWGPPALPRHQVLWHGRNGQRGDPHGDQPDPALLAITVPEVLAACRRAVG